MAALAPVIALLLGLGLGGLAVWLFCQARTRQMIAQGTATADSQIATLTERVQGREQQISDCKAVLSQRDNDVIRLEQDLSQKERELEQISNAYHQSRAEVS